MLLPRGQVDLVDGTLIGSGVEAFSSRLTLVPAHQAPSTQLMAERVTDHTAEDLLVFPVLSPTPGLLVGDSASAGSLSGQS